METTAKREKAEMAVMLLHLKRVEADREKKKESEEVQTAVAAGRECHRAEIASWERWLEDAEAASAGERDASAPYEPVDAPQLDRQERDMRNNFTQLGSDEQGGDERSVEEGN